MLQGRATNSHRCLSSGSTSLQSCLCNEPVQLINFLVCVVSAWYSQEYIYHSASRHISIALEVSSQPPCSLAGAPALRKLSLGPGSSSIITG
jgi:hypothetical protein